MKSWVLTLGCVLLAASSAAGQVSSGVITVNNQEMT